MRLSFYSLSLVGAVILSQQVAAASTTNHKSSVNLDISNKSLEKQCESILNSLTKSSKILFDECLNSNQISYKLKEQLRSINNTILETKPRYIAQARPLSLESLQRQIDALRNKIVQLESQASISASAAEKRELFLEQSVAELTKEVNILKIELEGKKLEKGELI